MNAVKNIKLHLIIIISLFLSFNSFSCTKGFSAKKKIINSDMLVDFKPLPSKKFIDSKDNPVTDAKVKLGKLLYFDQRLSKSGAISCNSCHNLFQGGVDNRPKSIGHGWKTGGRNSPTVLNSALNFVQFWDGRAKDLEEQAEAPILNPVEMASTKELVVQRLKNTRGYADLFKKAFPGEKEPLNYGNVAKAIAAFERTLLTPSRFDRYLKGDEDALTLEEKKGLVAFVETGCTSCHNGVGIGGGMFAQFQYDDDTGRYSVTKKEEDRFVFKVPSLRNVEFTYPYFHSGDVWQLEKAVKIMAEKQLGITLDDEKAHQIASFLRSLSGVLPEVKVEIAPPSLLFKPDAK